MKKIMTLGIAAALLFLALAVPAEVSAEPPSQAAPTPEPNSTSTPVATPEPASASTPAATPVPTGQPVATPVPTGAPPALTPTPSDQPTRIPVGPTVRLRPNRTVITSSQDAIIDMFWDNSIINEATYILEVTVDVPTGLYLYSADGAMGCGAGTCKGLFEIPPGSVRTLPLIVKADEVGEKFIHMTGRYFPQGNPELWNPISLTTPIDVQAKSESTGPPTPVPPPSQPTPTPAPEPGLGVPLWIVVVAIVAVVVVLITIVVYRRS